MRAFTLTNLVEVGLEKRRRPRVSAPNPAEGDGHPRYLELKRRPPILDWRWEGASGKSCSVWSAHVRKFLKFKLLPATRSGN